MTFLERILVHVPSRRPTITDILSSQWINHQNITLESSIVPSPQTKASTKQAKKILWFSRKRIIQTNIEANPDYTHLLFNTKRANSVLAEHFLHPIDTTANKEEANKPIEKKRTRSRSIFSNSLKKRIGPLDDGSNRDSNARRSLSNSEQIEALRKTVESSSKQNSISHIDDENDEEERGDFVMAPTNTDDITLLHPFEIESRSILEKLGISNEMLFQSIESGPRSDVIGAYRIVIHRLQRRKLFVQQHEIAELHPQPQQMRKTQQKCTIL